MSTVMQDSRFLRRFDTLWLRIRRVRFGQALAVAGLTALLGLAGLVAADYLWELPRAARAGGLAIVGTLICVCIAGLTQLYWRSGSKPQTAADVERAFPKLGQSVRTVVQFGAASPDQVRAAGVWESLVVALEEETHARSRPLYLDSVVPIAGLRMALGALMVAVVTLGLAFALNWEWRVAAQRVALYEVPYTAVAVAPGNIRIDQGQSVELQIGVSGRTDRKVVLQTRPAGSDASEWTEREFARGEATPSGPYAVSFVAALDSVKRPLEYRALVGDSISEIYRVDVRLPIALKSIEVELTPPAYTNQPALKSQEPNINAVEGTIARFAVTFDQPPQTAALILTDLRRPTDDDEPAAPQTLPLVLNGVTATGELEVTADRKYSIVAETGDALRLPPNSYRIRVRPDQAPEVYFEAPEDGIEVHTLAEILMRIRVRDDFGIAKAGIIFEVNNEEEYPLMDEEFAISREDLDAQGKLSPETQAALEKVLPLEFFELKQTDSVAYYAYAEDNYPGRSHRTVTDLRFIDIRPFRIRYSVRDDMPGNADGPPGPEIATLEELIKRQRFNLNRTMNLERKTKRNEKIDLSVVDGVVTSEAEIAQATRELADFLTNLMADVLEDEIQLLLLAEANMLAAVDSLSAGKYDTAVLQERDALKELIEGRNRLRIEIQKNPRRFQGLAAADRRMAQKLRKPKSDAEEAAEIVRRLRQLAAEQEGLKTDMTAMILGAGRGESPPQDPEATPENAAPMPPAEPTPSSQPDESASAAAAPSEQPGDAEANASDSALAGSAAKSGTRSRDEVRDKQLENSIEAQDLEQALGKLKNITDLAKQRMASAREEIESAGAAFERGDTPAAIEGSDQAVTTLKELAQQVEALVKEEAAERLNAARQLAMQLAEEQQALAMQTPNPSAMGGASEPPKPESEERSPAVDGMEKSATPQPGDSRESGDQPPESDTETRPAGNSAAGDQPDAKSPEGGRGPSEKPQENPRENPENPGGVGEPSRDDPKPGPGAGEDLEDAAERNAATGETILDILKSIQRSTETADKEVIERVESLMQDSQLEETVARMGGIAGQLRNSEFAGAAATAADSAERLEIVAQRLSTAFRELTAPKLENLMELERKLQELREQLENLETERDVVDWHRAAGDLLKEMDDLKVAGGVREQLTDLMEKAGWSPGVDVFKLNDNGGWVYSGENLRFGPAPGYVIVMDAVARELQTYIQELILDDMQLGAADAVPPQYEDLVERYYQVLAKQKRPQGTR
ncbi:MAG: DUF4175 family protein [Planctomycetaceae bacterium]|nr:DUF4175 family protein [Planctomycetaceae bacterium]